MQIPKALQISLISFLILSFKLFTPTFVLAAVHRGDYEEVSYEDLLSELKSKKTRLAESRTSSFDEIRLHAGIGYINSFTNISSQKQNFNRHATGIQLSVGMDLFSANWYSEGIFKNYGLTTYGSEEMTLREFDIKLGYTDKLETIWSYSLSAGLSNRFLQFTDPVHSIDANSTTPCLLIATGFKAQVHKNLSVGAEFSAHNPIISRTADKNSFDFAFRMTTSL